MKHKKGTLIPYIIFIILLLIFNVPYPVHRELSGVLIQLENPEFVRK